MWIEILRGLHKEQTIVIQLASDEADSTCSAFKIVSSNLLTIGQFKNILDCSLKRLLIGNPNCYGKLLVANYGGVIKHLLTQGGQVTKPKQFIIFADMCITSMSLQGAIPD